MTEEQLQQIDQARRYAEQDDYVVTRTHIRNLLAIIERQGKAPDSDRHKKGCASITRMLLSDSPKPAGCDCGEVERQAASVPDGVKELLSGWMAFSKDVATEDAAGADWLRALRAKTDAMLAAALEAPKS